MSALLVLGEGWLGTAVAQVARRQVPVTTVDPPLDPALRARDAAARRALRALVDRSGATAVVNACGLVRGSDADLRDANADFPSWLCSTLDRTGVRLVHIGSASEYGDPASDRPVAESAPARPVGPYAETKAAGTDAVLQARSGGLDAVVARVFNVVGHPVPSVSPLHQWISDLGSLHGPDGEVEVWWPDTVRDFVTITDVAGALVDLATADDDVPALVNVCSGVGLRYGDIVVALARRLGLEVRVRSLERAGITTVIGDPSLLARVTGATPTMDLGRLARTALPEPAGAGSGGTGGEGAANR